MMLVGILRRTKKVTTTILLVTVLMKKILGLTGIKSINRRRKKWSKA